MSAGYPSGDLTSGLSKPGDEAADPRRDGEAVDHLNATAAFLRGACDGTLNATDLAERLGAASK